MQNLVRWIARPIFWTKLNCDGASKENIGHSGGWGLIRDGKGALSLSYGNYYGYKISVWAEAMAVLDGFELA